MFTGSYMTYNPASSGAVNALPLGNNFINMTGSLINKATPLTVDPITGYAELVNIADSSASAVFGLSFNDVLDTNTGDYITMGIIENVSISANFSDEIFVSKSGGLTNIPPDIGVGGFVEGDTIIFVGTIKKNKNNPLYKDLIVSMDVRGTL